MYHKPTRARRAFPDAPIVYVMCNHEFRGSDFANGAKTGFSVIRHRSGSLRTGVMRVLCNPRLSITLVGA
ncbi:MAG: hypothetical protein AB7P31_12540 [Steroidobacteraceae bacterium]